MAESTMEALTISALTVAALTMEAFKMKYFSVYKSPRAQKYMQHIM
jgi:hypothetical protein